MARRRVLLSRYTSLQVGGRAEFFAEPTTVDQAVELVEDALKRGLRLRFLGGGTNLLVDDVGVKGLVISTRNLRGLEGLWAMAGTPLPALLRQLARKRLSGLECLSGIPGTIGGAAVGNAGTRFGTIGSRIEAVRVVRGGKVVEIKELRFDYRSSSLGDDLVLGVKLRLEEQDPERILKAMERARSQRNDPVGRSAGCIFRNPPTGPSAGELIEGAGFKGARVGGARVSRVHANWILCESGATAEDVARLIGRIRERLPQLSLEVKVWSDRDEFLELCHEKRD